MLTSNEEEGIMEVHQISEQLLPENIRDFFFFQETVTKIKRPFRTPMRL